MDERLDLSRKLLADAADHETIAPKYRGQTAMLEREAVEALEFMAGALRTIASVAKERKITDIYGIAQSGLDLATLGENGCAEMRGDAPTA